MAVLTPQRIDKAGVADLSAALSAADVAGDSVPSSAGLFVVMENGDVSPHTLTVAAPVATKDCGNLGALDVDPIVLTVAAGAIGVLALPAGYANLGVFEWTYDDVTNVTVGVFVANP